MPLDAWLPVGFALPGGMRVKLAVQEGADWQIFEAQGGGRALVAKAPLAQRWVEAGLLEQAALGSFSFGRDKLMSLTSAAGKVLAPVAAGRSVKVSAEEALAFGDAMRLTREADADSALHDAIFSESVPRLLPTYTLSSPVRDDVVLGTWLSRGVPVSVTAFRRLSAVAGWMSDEGLLEVIQRAGFVISGGKAPGTCSRVEKGSPGGHPQTKRNSVSPAARNWRNS